MLSESPSSTRPAERVPEREQSWCEYITEYIASGYSNIVIIYFYRDPARRELLPDLEEGKEELRKPSLHKLKF